MALFWVVIKLNPLSNLNVNIMEWVPFCIKSIDAIILWFNLYRFPKMAPRKHPSRGFLRFKVRAESHIAESYGYKLWCADRIANLPQYPFTVAAPLALNYILIPLRDLGSWQFLGALIRNEKKHKLTDLNSQFRNQIFLIGFSKEDPYVENPC